MPKYQPRAFEDESPLPRRLIEEFDTLIRRDPARRGLIASEPVHGRLCAGHLADAAEHLAACASHVGIVTGFYVPHGEPPAAETDGPLGAMLLASALHALGVEVTLLTDEFCAGAVAAAIRAVGFSEEALLVYPHDRSSWVDEFFTVGRGRSLTHLIAVERVGPSHTLESLNNQPRQSAAPVEEFISRVPAESHNCCHNMHGTVIDGHTADMYRLFEELGRYRPAARTIGIGDGANEIGMGSIPWEDLHRRLDGKNAARIPCRVATDWNIVAGTSNWGAYALAAAVLVLCDRTVVLRDWGREHQRHVLQQIVEHGPAVDGITARNEPTVDGLPFMTFIQPWEGIRRLLGFED